MAGRPAGCAILATAGVRPWSHLPGRGQSDDVLATSVLARVGTADKVDLRPRRGPAGVGDSDPAGVPQNSGAQRPRQVRALRSVTHSGGCRRPRRLCVSPLRRSRRRGPTRDVRVRGAPWSTTRSTTPLRPPAKPPGQRGRRTSRPPHGAAARAPRRRRRRRPTPTPRRRPRSRPASGSPRPPRPPPTEQPADQPPEQPAKKASAKSAKKSTSRKSASAAAEDTAPSLRPGGHRPEGGQEVRVSGKSAGQQTLADEHRPDLDASEKTPGGKKSHQQEVPRQEVLRQEVLRHRRRTELRSRPR